VHQIHKTKFRLKLSADVCALLHSLVERRVLERATLKKKKYFFPGKFFFQLSSFPDKRWQLTCSIENSVGEVKIN
jgi:hypothetical protein